MAWCSVAAKGHAARWQQKKIKIKNKRNQKLFCCSWQQKGLPHCGSEKGLLPSAHKKPTNQRQQKSMLLYCSKKACCSVAAEEHATQLELKSLPLSGSKRACYSVAVKKLAAQ